MTDAKLKKAQKLIKTKKVLSVAIRGNYSWDRFEETFPRLMVLLEDGHVLSGNFDMHRKLDKETFKKAKAELGIE